MQTIPTDRKFSEGNHHLRLQRIETEEHFHTTVKGETVLHV